MRKQISIIIVLVTITSFFSGCVGETKRKENPPAESKVQYICPMKCSEQTFDKPGKCPECGMELEVVGKG
jgi:hypothetical protein